jgi:type IV pilus biogenesis/stability protein PilW
MTVPRPERRSQTMKTKTIAVLVLCLSLAFCASSQSKLQRSREKDPQYQYNLGNFYLNQGNFDEALKYFNKSLALNEDYHLAWNSLGVTYMMKGDVEGALKAFQRCLTIAPMFTEARNNLGTLYQESGQLDRAEAEYVKAAQDLNYERRENPNFNLARLYALQNRLEEAFEYVQKAIQINPRFAMAFNLKGQIFEKRENWAEALASYEAAVKLVPEDLLFNYNLAVALFRTEDFVKARSVFLKINARVTDLETKEKIGEYLKIINERIR